MITPATTLPVLLFLGVSSGIVFSSKFIILGSSIVISGSTSGSTYGSSIITGSSLITSVGNSRFGSTISVSVGFVSVFVFFGFLFVPPVGFLLVPPVGFFSDGSVFCSTGALVVGSVLT